jgi:hypothetical protein
MRESDVIRVHATEALEHATDPRAREEIRRILSRIQVEESTR